MRLPIIIFLTFLINNSIARETSRFKTYVVKAHTNEEVSTDSDDKNLENWWKTAVFYQIYPRSFQDSDGDGIGDLKGIFSRLSYLKDAGITAVWLSPIFTSPQVDQGYDISDYKDIDPAYGTLADLKNLTESAHDLGIKIILDFVPNHSSDKHEWFTKSVQKDPDYEDFYVWVDGTEGTPPNNWLSVFKDSAWTWNSDRKQYYLHQFAAAQPDLNYRNPKVVEAMKDVLTYWMDFGVDGFRMDAVPHLFEIEDLLDEPLSNLPGYAKTDYEYLNHIYTKDQPETFDMIYEFRQLLDDYNTKDNSSYRIMMTEAYSSMDTTMLYYGASNGATLGAHFSFNFNLITDIQNSDFTVDDIVNSIDKWESAKPAEYVSNWVIGNHDNHRAATRFGPKNTDTANMLVAFLPGIMVTYNGEEIGMEDGNVTCKEGHDPQAINDCTTFNKNSRDFERTPFQWDNTTNGGFSSSKTTWLPVSSKYLETNVEEESVKGVKSHYHVYQDLINFRENFVNITHDALSIIVLNDNVLEIVRTTSKNQFILLFNIADEETKIDIFLDSGKYDVAVAGINSKLTKGSYFNKTSLAPHESLILVRTGTATSHGVTSNLNKFAALLVIAAVFKCFY